MAEQTIFDSTDQPDISINPDEAPPVVEPVADETPPKSYDEAYVKELNQEAGKWRLKLRESEAENKKYKAAEKTRGKEQADRDTQQLEAQGDYEKVKAQYEKQIAESVTQNESLLNQLADTKRQGLIMQIANQLEAIDPLDANFLTAANTIDPASTDAVEQIGKLFETIKEQKPYLFKSAQTNSSGVAQFNPPTNPDQRLNDRDLLAKINRQAGQAVSPFGTN